jgi:hypothetical protein
MSERPRIAVTNLAIPGGPVLPPIQVRRRYMMTPGSAQVGGALALAQPHEDDLVARAVGYAP